MTTVVAIHQPNFLPWLGFFDKIARSDVFVLLDDVQLQKTGGLWTNRVKVAVAGADAWLTVPVRRDYHGVRVLDDIRVDETKPWRAQLRKTLAANYGRTPHFTPTIALVDDVFAYEGDRLLDLNMRGLHTILAVLGWSARRLVLSSSLGCEGKGTERLVAISRAVRADVYLCGGGTGGYQEDEAFARSGVRLEYQNFAHPRYPQSRRAAFVEGLSILDALFELGPCGTARLLESSRA